MAVDKKEESSVIQDAKKECSETIKRVGEGIVLDLKDTGLYLFIYGYRWREEEIMQMNEEERFEMKLLLLYNIMFGLFKFGNMNWMEAPFSIHLTKKKELTEFPFKEGKKLKLHIYMIDMCGWLLKNQKEVELPKELSEKFIEMCKEQQRLEFNRTFFGKAVYRIYSEYSTNDLVMMAINAEFLD